MSPSLTKLAHLLQTRYDLHGFTPPADAAELIDHEVIPLSLALADAVITHLRGAAMEVRKAVENA
jgi:hypothetical protein